MVVASLLMVLSPRHIFISLTESGCALILLFSVSCAYWTPSLIMTPPTLLVTVWICCLLLGSPNRVMARLKPMGEETVCSMAGSRLNDPSTLPTLSSLHHLLTYDQMSELSIYYIGYSLTPLSLNFLTAPESPTPHTFPRRN